MNLSNETNKEQGLTFDGICKAFGGIQVLSDISFTAPEQKVIGLIGPNGAGKTTLINLTCGIFPLDGGDVRLNGESLCGLPPNRILKKGIARTFQEARMFPFLSVLDNVMVGLQGQEGENILHALFRTSAMRQDNKEQRQKALHILERLDLNTIADKPAGELAFGHKKLVDLARAIATEANVFLLDEPTAGVEPNMIPRVLELIRDLSTGKNKIVLIIEHNMDVIREVADWAVVLMVKIIAKGPVTSVLQDDRVIRDYLGRIDFAA